MNYNGLPITPKDAARELILDQYVSSEDDLNKIDDVIIEIALDQGWAESEVEAVRNHVDEMLPDWLEMLK